MPLEFNLKYRVQIRRFCYIDHHIPTRISPFRQCEWLGEGRGWQRRRELELMLLVDVLWSLDKSLGFLWITTELYNSVFWCFMLTLNGNCHKNFHIFFLEYFPYHTSFYHCMLWCTCLDCNLFCALLQLHWPVLNRRRVTARVRDGGGQSRLSDK